MSQFADELRRMSLANRETRFFESEWGKEIREICEAQAAKGCQNAEIPAIIGKTECPGVGPPLSREEMEMWPAFVAEVLRKIFPMSGTGYYRPSEVDGPVTFYVEW